MAERSVHEAAVEAVERALETTSDGGYAVGWHTLAAAAIAALVASAEVREGLVEALSPGRHLWRSPDDSQFASFNRDEMVVAILAALAGPEASDH